MKEDSGSEQKLRREISIAGHELSPGQIAEKNADDLRTSRLVGIGRQETKMPPLKTAYDFYTVTDGVSIRQLQSAYSPLVATPHFSSR